MIAKRFFIGLVLSCFLLGHSAGALGYERAAPLTDREIIERLTRLEEGQKAVMDAIRALERSMDARFDAIDKRFESIEKRFESIDKRFESIDNQFSRLYSLMIGIVAAFAGIVAVSIGFAIWDRRTMIRPFETRVRAIEEELAKDRTQFHRLMDALRSHANNDPRLAEVLRSFSLM